MVWREPKNHSDHCYFCSVNISGLTSKTTSSIQYPNLPSALQSIPHSNKLPVPVFKTFVWASLLSPNGPFWHGCSTNTESRDTSCILVVPEACTPSSNIYRLSSSALNTLTSLALVSWCHRIPSFELSDL